MVDHEFTIGVEVTNLEEVKELRKELERIKELKKEIKELEKDDEEETSPLDIPDEPFPSRRTRFWVEDADETFGPEQEFKPYAEDTGFYIKKEEDDENVIVDTQFEI